MAEKKSQKAKTNASERKQVATASGNGSAKEVREQTSSGSSPRNATAGRASSSAADQTPSRFTSSIDEVTIPQHLQERRKHPRMPTVAPPAGPPPSFNDYEPIVGRAELDEI